jgi:hypothetical protein
VITVILYGRNDAHGYNLHRRAALSLNCIAEVLTDPDDEIVFVDYNTPDELPTFVEALADTLTDRCLDVLRVFRVPAAIHAERFAARTHLPAIEPIARNAGVRRANPANRWLLSTNTDMVFLPLVSQSMSEICSALPDGFYGLPRFELPEWLWERLPRSDPQRAMADVARLGPGLHLDEPTLSNEWIRFDAPGDFQLVLRDDYLAIDGLDEEMLLGYHVDSNLSRRMLLHRGSIETVEASLAGYHCNHGRSPTVYHGTGTVANDLARFFVQVDRADIPEQRHTWGLADVPLEEVPVRERTGLRVADMVLAAIPPSAGPRSPSDAARVPFELTYDSGHILPFVADSLAVSAPDAVIGYLGANPVLERMLAEVVERQGFESPLALAAFADTGSIEELARTADVIVVDLGVDASLVDASVSEARNHQPAPLPAGLDRALDALDRLVELERARLEKGEHPRRFVLVHSWTVFWDAYVLANFDCSHMTAHSRVRRATVKLVPSWDEATREALARERRLARWATRGEAGDRRMHLRTNEAVVVNDLTEFSGFGDGWSFPDDGIWTQGSRSELALALDGIGEGDCILTLSLGSICVRRDASLRVEALVDGERAAARDFHFGDAAWRIELPPGSPADGQVDLAFEIEEPTTPHALGWSSEDERPLGINVRALTIDEVDRSVRAGERIVFVEGSPAARVLGEGWSALEPTGVWTDGETASLVLKLTDFPPGDAELVLDGYAFVTPDHPELEVEITAHGEQLGGRVYQHRRRILRRILDDHPLRVPLPVSARDETGRTVVDLHLRDPVSPLDLRLSEDTRPLGLHLRSLTVRSGGPTAATRRA